MKGGEKMKVADFIKRLKQASNSKTLYINGCFGAPMTSSNKARYKKNTSYNMKPERQKLIDKATTDTFGFDCVCLIKGILWGWSGSKKAEYGGAKYQSNGVPDCTIESMVKNYSTNVSTDFKNIEVGEILVTADYGHCGVYIGNGEAIECTNKWEDGVQVTGVRNISVNAAKGRTWAYHAKLNFVEYDDVNIPKCEILAIVSEETTKEERNAVKTALEKSGFDNASILVLAKGG